MNLKTLILIGIGGVFLVSCIIPEHQEIVPPIKIKSNNPRFSNNQQPISAQEIDSTGQLAKNSSSQKTSETESVRFAPYRVPPEPIGGYMQIQKNVIYPQQTRKAGIEGTVIVQVKILANGKVGETRIIKGVPNHLELSEAAIQAIRRTKWRPGQDELGRSVAIWISIPIVFRL